MGPWEINHGKQIEASAAVYEFAVIKGIRVNLRWKLLSKFQQSLYADISCISHPENNSSIVILFLLRYSSLLYCYLFRLGFGAMFVVPRLFMQGATNYTSFKYDIARGVLK